MTGLDPERDMILEIATIVTDSQLEVVAEGPNLAIHQSDETLSKMDEWNQTHHRASGLMERVKRSAISAEYAEQETLDFLVRHCEKGVAPLCGNSIWQDRRFLVKYMPKLHAFFHYRNIDVSSIKELVHRWYPDFSPFQKKESHLALADIRESLEELRHYRQRIFPEKPFPAA